MHLSFPMYLISQFVYSCLLVNLLVCPHPPDINLILVMSLLESLFRPQLSSRNWCCHPCGGSLSSSLAFRSSLLDPVSSSFLVNACISVEHIDKGFLKNREQEGDPFLMSWISDHVLQGLANWPTHNMWPARELRALSTFLKGCKTDTEKYAAETIGGPQSLKYLLSYPL